MKKIICDVCNQEFNEDDQDILVFDLENNDYLDLGKKTFKDELKDLDASFKLVVDYQLCIDVDKRQHDHICRNCINKVLSSYGCFLQDLERKEDEGEC